MCIVDRIRLLSNKKGCSITTLEESIGLGNGTIGKWKTKNPSCDKLKLVADFLGVSMDYLYSGEKSSSITLSEDETELITHYKKLPEKEQAKLISRAEAIAERYEEEQREFERQREQNIEYISRDRFLEKVSAGTGLYLSDDSKEPMDIEKNDTTIMTDYILTVSGDSMEPLYHNNDMLLVKYYPKIDVGQIGIFVINGEGYVKKFGGDRLISLNPDYPDIMLSENDSIYCQGKVLGVLDPKLTREYHESTLNKV